ncbi:hotdog family protein [Shewanella sp. AS16]|uniref:hotdog family protein n=1 Tax=Shewanella sp. AS16 TaxID=2907625 RepID=UPI001F21E542|nr:hotdog family protein [Shewanella sp. AS16]MCE9687947.1 hotdog family protein [Shewanella sp. AS16]
MPSPLTSLELSQLQITELVPHRQPMVLIDALVSHSPDSLITETRISKDSAYFDDQLQGVPNYVGIEYMAQSIAALAGIEAKLRGDTVRVGFLLGSRKLSFATRTYRLGQSYNTRVTRLYQEDSGLAVFDCEIYHGETRVAAAQVNVFQPQDTQAFVQEAQAEQQAPSSQ